MKSADLSRCFNHTSGEMLKGEKGGVALVLVIWLIVVLIAIVGEFSYSMRTEINIARNFKEEEEAYQLALAGIEQAKLEILSVKEPAIVYLSEDNVLSFGIKDEGEVPVRKDTLGNGIYEYKITDEDGKFNINTALTDPLYINRMKYIMSAAGLEGTELDTVVDSIIDWQDPNEEFHLNGAEEEYYRSLENPYSCKDGPFDSIEEMLLVKGMKREFLYGSKPDTTDEEGKEEEEKKYEGMEKYLTVYGGGAININTASSLVLETVLGADVAQNVILQREAGPIMSAISNGKVTSEFYTIISTGSNKDGTIKRSIKTVMRKNNKKLETLYWNDNYIG